jgi:hypothetical protein
MPEFLQRNPLVLVLGGFAAALLVVIALEAGWGFGRTGAPASTAGKAAVVDSKLLPPLTDVAPEQLYPETGARPLFTPTRRPDPPAEAVGTMVKGRFVLQGVTILGDTRIAMLRDKTTSKIYRVEKGRDADGVVVENIESERVTLRQGGDSEVVTLSVQKAGAGPAPTAAPAPATPAASLTGPFGAPAPGAPGGPLQAGAPAAPRPGAPPGASQSGAPPVPSQGGPIPAQGGPMVPQSPPGAAPPTPGTSSTAPATPAAAMTPEELLARRRARRAQQAQ